MKNSNQLILFVFAILISCNKESAVPQPKADFSADGTDATSLIIGTHDALYPINNSTNETSVIWDFGNGTTSKEKNPKVTYSNPGNYSLTLTAYGQGGAKNSITKNITVKERILTTITLDKIFLNKLSAAQAANIITPMFSKLDLWIELKFSQGPMVRTANNDIIAPTIFKTPVFAQIDSSFHSSIVYYIPQSEKVIVDYPVSDSDYYQNGVGLVANIYGKDDTTSYLLFSTSWAGFAFLGSTDPSISNSFSAWTNVPGSQTTLKLDCQFK